MSYVADVLDNIVPISDFSRGKASQIFDKATGSTPVIVTKNNTPTAVILSPEEYRYLAQAEEDLHLLGLAMERLEANEGTELLTHEQVMTDLGLAEEDLENAGEVEFEYE